MALDDRGDRDLPNVTMKLGGMMMRLAAYDYNALPAPPSSVELAGYWRPYIEPCIEKFGARRCTFESNFPVDKMGIGYRALWNAFKHIDDALRPMPRAVAARKAVAMAGIPPRNAPNTARPEPMNRSKHNR